MNNEHRQVMVIELDFKGCVNVCYGVEHTRSSFYDPGDNTSNNDL